MGRSPMEDDEASDSAPSSKGPKPQELLERVSRINGGSPAAWADSFVQHVLSPQGTFAAEREEGAYPQQQLPTPEDPL